MFTTRPIKTQEQMTNVFCDRSFYAGWLEGLRFNIMLSFSLGAIIGLVIGNLIARGNI